MAHLNQLQRYTISCMLKQGHNQSQIAKAKSVVSREVKRNSGQRSGIYKYELANKKYAQLQKEKPKIKRFTSEIQDFVASWLKEDYSPEQIVGKSKNENIARVSIERICQHVWQDKKKKGVCTLI